MPKLLLRAKFPVSHNSHCGRGKIRTHNSTLWAQPKEMERPTLSLVLTQYIDERSRGEVEEADRLRSPKSEHYFEGFK